MGRDLRQMRYVGRPVRSLQTMLRAISFQYPAIPRLIPDGVFGERTLEAVMVFHCFSGIALWYWCAIISRIPAILLQLPRRTRF